MAGLHQVPPTALVGETDNVPLDRDGADLTRQFESRFGDVADVIRRASREGGRSRALPRSDGYRVRLWKTELAQLAADIGIAITVCH